ncbi:MAG: glucose-6-phosphate dehydrogenase assembly protein OpcA [Rubrobacter sp.]|nr:glucose-6-phosphate dehydrogenase assembly protein OpcA [Rubrobacter sp.]
MSEHRSSPGSGAMSVEQIEREFGRLRMNEDGTLGLRASVLNLVTVTGEESAGEVTRVVSKLAGRFPCRAIVMISDPEEETANLDIRVSAFCDARGGGGSQVCAEQVEVHAEGPPARHLKSLAGPLLLPDLPVFLWYPGAFSSGSPEFSDVAELADRVVVNSGAASDHGACLRELSDLTEDAAMPAIGDLQWVGLSPWRSLVAGLFDPPDRREELDRIHRVEILHDPRGEARALLLAGWLGASLGWRPESVEEDGGSREFAFAGPSGEVTVALDSRSEDASLRRVRLHGQDLTFQVSRHRELSEARSTVMRGDDLIGERTVHLGFFDQDVILGEELRFRRRDESYAATLRTVAEMLAL